MSMLNKPEDNYGEMSLGDLDDIHSADTNYQQWRYDSATCEEYYDGNQYDLQSTEDADNSGIALTTANWVRKLVNDMSGIQQTALTSWKVRGENSDHQDMYDALGAELFKVAKLTKADRHRIKAYNGQMKPGIGWLEVGYESNPLLGKFYVDHAPWREMWFDLRAMRPDLEDGQWVRRARVSHKEYLKKKFSGIADIDTIVEAAPTPSNARWNTIEPSQQYRAFTQRRARDVPKSYQNTAKDRDLRMPEEVWYPVYLEGLFVTLPNGRVLLYDDSNPMMKMMVGKGIVPVCKAPYKRWRRAIWLGQVKVDDIWSPFPWMGHPYIAFFGYREAMTGVPYGPVRDMLSLQDEINSSAAKFHAGMDQVTVFVEEDALSAQTSHKEVRDGIGDKRSYVILKKGGLNRIKVEHHFQLTEQNYKRMQDAERQLQQTTPMGGLNPAGVNQPGQMDAVTMRAMAGLGEINGNYLESSTLLGERLLSLIKEDIAHRGDVEVDVKKHDGARVKVRLHAKVGIHHEHGAIIANDVTMLAAEVALDEVPHTATYRGQQLQDLTKVLQSAPKDAAQLRTVGTSMVIRLMDIPHSNELADMILKQAGLIAPQTPEEAQAAQEKARQAQEDRQITVESALAQIGHRKAQSEKLIADTELKKAMAASAMSEIQNPAYEQANKQLLLERSAAQNRRTAAQAAKIEKELSEPSEPAPPPPPEPLPPNW